MEGATTGEARFLPIGRYSVPAMPTEHALRRRLMRLKRAVLRETDAPAVADDSLARATPDVLDELASPPACGPLVDELERTLAPWLGKTQRTSRLKLVVLPPCDRHDVVEAWAREHGHAVVSAPSRRALFEGVDTRSPLAADARGLLVIPRLEHWFLRHHRGLQAIRALLAGLDGLDRPCVVGCNSWAWAWLATATGAGVILPQAIVPQAFDAARLHSWFASLAQADSNAAITFRLAGTGDDVFAVDAAGAPSHRHLQQLAARSFGIPWVAWALWRDSLRIRSDADELSPELRDAAATDARTMWVAEPAEPELPPKHEGSSLLVLQSLLIHGELDAESLHATLPSGGDPDVVPALVATGFVERDDGIVRVRPSAYPAARERLEAAGYPLDVL